MSPVDENHRRHGSQCLQGNRPSSPGCQVLYRPAGKMLYQLGFAHSCCLAAAIGLREKDKNMALTKAEIVQIVVDNVGLNKREALEMVEAFFEEIGASLEAGEDVKLSGFGGFQLRKKAERPGRNPKTGETARVTARRVVTFHPSQKLKLMVSGFVSKRQESRQADKSVRGALGVQR